MTQNLTPENLAQFYGSENLYRDGFYRFTYTEGVKYLRDNGAAWLAEFISLRTGEHRSHSSQFWKLKLTNKETPIVVCEDGDKKLLKAYPIPFTDFPFDNFPNKELSIWFIDGTMLLPSEY